VARHDVIVIGAGISGLAFAAHAARAGRSVLVVDEGEHAGGCLATRAGPGDFWIELGAHTCYNSYTAFIELLEDVGALGELQARARPVLRFLDGDAVLPGRNLGALLRLLRPWPLLTSLPRGLFTSPAGKTVREYYGGLVGAENYDRVLGPMMSAVPSQRADALPAEMLFKKRRARRKDVLRSFTLRGGLGSIAAAVTRLPGVSVETGRRATGVTASGVSFDGGGYEEADLVAVATPPGAAARLLSAIAPDAAAAAGAVRESTVESTGVVVRADRVKVPPVTFFIPLQDVFHSVVTRDVVPHPELRGFVFHFKPELGREARLERVGRFLGVATRDLERVEERRTILPSPAVGHAAIVEAIDRAIAGTRVAVTGNWFAGLAIEDCVLRSRAEWRRLGGPAPELS
jgi:protoporphyrinogen/coproporphyrinogen III oxidase